MGVMAGSPARTLAIVTGLLGAVLGVLFGISIASFAASASGREAAATGPGRGAGLVEPWLFEAPFGRE